MDNAMEWRQFLEYLSELTREVQSRKEQNVDSLTLMKEKLCLAMEGISELELLPGFSEVGQRLKDCFEQLNFIVDQAIQHLSNTSYYSTISALKVYTGERGRPKLEISEDALLYFRELGFKWKEIAAIFKVSRWTVMRRVDELDLRYLTGFSCISDERLDELMSEFKSIHGIAGGRSLALGFLKSRNLRVQQRRVTEALVRVDPMNSRLRWACVIKRRVYKVPAANSLWHIDGNHSLVNWGFVIHGAIDGFSRMIVYLQCSTNNLSTTVLNLFDTAIQRCGCPSRLRTDKGGENVLIWERIVNLRGANRGSFIAGSSVHNQRIERLWRDVWAYVTSQFYYIFQSMEAQGLLDMSNEYHVYILHYIYLPRINDVIEMFSVGWNRHPLRTEGNRSPEKIWMSSMLDSRNTSILHIRDLYESNNVASNNIARDDISWCGTSNPDRGYFEDLPYVDVQSAQCPLSQEQKLALEQIDPRQQSNNFGVDIFVQALSLLS